MGKYPTPRIFLADLLAYTRGELRGTWVDATQDPEGMMADVAEELGVMPDELAIHDHENFGGYSVSETESLDVVHVVACLIKRHGQAFAVWASDNGDTIFDQGFDAEDEFFEQYIGEYENPSDLAQSLADDYGTITTAIGSVELTADQANILNAYLDWSKIGDDLLIDAFFSVPSASGIYVYRRV